MAALEPVPAPAPPATVPGTFVHLDPRRLEKSNNPRRQPVAASYITEIAESMRKHHVLEPLIVRPTKNGLHQVVAGDTRQKAAIEAGLALVPCIVRDLNDLDMLEVQLIENVQRNSMHPVDEGEAFKRLIDGRKYTPELLAKTMGKSLRWVYNRLEFTKLIPAVRDAFLAHHITATHAELLARLEAADQQEAFNDGLFHRTFLDEPGGDDPKKPHVVSVRDLQRWMEDHVRLNVRTDAVQHLIPGIEEVVDEADAAARAVGTSDARILQVTRAYMVPPDPKLRERLKGVLFERHWKPADSTKQRCEFAEKGVIVYGTDQGRVLLVCANKQCPKHFPEHTPAAKQKRAKQRERQSAAPSVDRTAAREQKEREERARKDARWGKLLPALRAATSAAIDKLTVVPPSVLAEALKVLQLKTVKARELPMMLTRAAFNRRFSGYTWHNEEPGVATFARAVGVDVKAIERATFPPAETVVRGGKKKKSAVPPQIKQQMKRFARRKPVRAKRAGKAGKKR